MAMSFAFRRQGVTNLSASTALYLLIVLSRALAAWWEGDRFRLWDRLRGGGFYTEARDGVWNVLVSLLFGLRVRDVD